MAVSGINNTRKLLLKPFSVRCMSRLARPCEVKSSSSSKEGGGERQSEGGGGWWMPHPRSGIYFPRGQEWVMDDIPTHAASFDCTFWLRGNDGGVDHHKHNQDFHTPSFTL